MSWASPEEIFLSTSLASYLDKKLLVLLRDGRKLLGTLRSFDQFANAVLEGACDRVIVGELYCDIPLGLYVIRGENVVLIGELVCRASKFEVVNIHSASFPRSIDIVPYITTRIIGQAPGEEELPPHMTRVSVDEIRRAQKVERDAWDLKGTMRKRMEFLDMD